MNSSLKCTVIIPTYNRAQLLGYTLESLARQSLSRDQFEVLVCDDGSSDTTSAVVAGYRELLDVRYFYQADEGFRAAKARNTGIAHARADVCVFIDTGVLPQSGCLAAHVASHESAPGPVAVCGYVYCFNIDNEDAARMNQVIDFEDPDATIEILRKRAQWLDVREDFYARYSDDFHEIPAPWLVYWGCNASARTEQLRSVGMFDEAFAGWGGEDVDLGYRLHRDRARVILNRHASAIHCPHEKSFDGNMKSLVNNYRYMGKKYQTPITQLLADEPTINTLTMNDVIRERGLPMCAEYLAQRQAAGRGALRPAASPGL